MTASRFIPLDQIQTRLVGTVDLGVIRTSIVMVDIGTWNRLTPEEQSEFSALKGRFIKAVFASDAYDGSDFGIKYCVAESENLFYLSSTENNEPFAGITSENRAVIEALLTDAVQNYGR